MDTTKESQHTIKASDLRIGNYTADSMAMDGYIKITEHNFSHVLHRLTNNGFAKIYEPIPLTEEWLIKFGFENSRAKSAKMWMFYPSFKLHNNSNVLRINVALGIVIIGGKKIDCKYVHQLQNLYFALTGEELICK